MTILFSQIRTYIYDWVTANIPNGMPAIYQFNNSPRPTIDYVTIYLMYTTQIGWDWTQDPLDDTGISQMVGDREICVQIQAFGGDPLTVLNNLRTSLQKNTVLASLAANGIAFANWYPINDITALIDSRFEQRASMDVLFRVADVSTESIGNINTVNLTEKIYDPTGALVVNETIQIPPS